MKRPKTVPATAPRITKRRDWVVVVHAVPSSEPARTIVETQHCPIDTKRAKITSSTCRCIAERQGWVAHDVPGSPEILFAKPGRVFLATFDPPAALQAAHARLRNTGTAVYRPENAGEWSAILEYENRVTESAP